MGSEDFKSFCRALITSGVGSIPTRSRQLLRGVSGQMLLSAVLAGLFVATAWSAPTEMPANPTDGVVVPDTTQVTAVPDTTQITTVPDTSRVGSTDGDPLDPVAPIAGERFDPPRLRQIEKRPSVAWTTSKSGLVPGWGQLTNKKPLKAGLFFGAWAFFAGQALAAEQDRKSAQQAFDQSGALADMNSVNAAVDHRNSRLWWMGGVALFSMLDAYVDVHFWDFEKQWSARVGPTAQGGAALALGVRFE